MAKDKWDKAEIIIRIISALLVPIIITIIGVYFNSTMKDKDYFQKDQELKLKNIEIAINILSGKPTIDNQPLRDWAISTINNNSQIKLSQAAIKILKEKSLPKQRTIITENPVTIIDGGDFITDDTGKPIILK
jgi:hypothetical protein